MKNYIQPGDNIEVIAPSAIDSGELVKVGQIFGVATADAANGDPVVISTRGVFRMSKLSNDAITAGARLYRHASGANAGRLTDTVVTDALVGVAVEAAGANISTVACRLNGSF